MFFKEQRLKRQTGSKSPCLRGLPQSITAMYRMRD